MSASKLFGEFVFYSLVIKSHSSSEVVIKYDFSRWQGNTNFDVFFKSLSTYEVIASALQKMAKRSSVQAKHTISECDKAGDRKDMSSHPLSDLQKVGSAG